MGLFNNALFLLFPTVCGICERINKNGICEQCYTEIKEKNKLIINDYSTDETKYFCQHGYLFSYEGIIREKILQYKFNEKAYLADMFYEILLKNEKVCRLFENYDIIIPVPISKKRLKERGYNQSDLIAKKISKKYNIIYKNILIKYKNNLQQSKLNKMQRIQNVKGVYKLQNELVIKNKKVLIFDDIYTTGSTVNECAKTICKAGAKQVGIFTIAKDNLVI